MIPDATTPSKILVSNHSYIDPFINVLAYFAPNTPDKHDANIPKEKKRYYLDNNF